MGRGDDAHRDGPHPVVPQASHLAGLEHAQELRLQLQRHLGDLVEEEGASIRASEEPLTILGRSRVGPAAGSEELGLEERLREGRDALGDQGPPCAMAPVVEGPGDQLLARAARARDHHGQLGRRQPLHESRELGHRRAPAHHPGEGKGLTALGQGLLGEGELALLELDPLLQSPVQLLDARALLELVEGDRGGVRQRLERADVLVVEAGVRPIVVDVDGSTHEALVVEGHAEHGAEVELLHAALPLEALVQGRVRGRDRTPIGQGGAHHRARDGRVPAPGVAELQTARGAGLDHLAACEDDVAAACAGAEQRPIEDPFEQLVPIPRRGQRAHAVEDPLGLLRRGRARVARTPARSCERALEVLLGEAIVEGLDQLTACVLEA